MSDRTSTQTWSAFAAGDLDARDLLLREHLSLVHHVAQQLARNLAADADMDELVSAGTMGLMSALETFDVGRGLAFSTFAVPRIRGSILDELRRQDHVPRSVRKKARDMGHARERLMREHGRPPEDKELAAALDVDVETLWKWQADVESAVQVPLDRSAPDRDGPGGSVWELLASEDEESVEDRMTREQEVVMLREAILGLKEQERTVLSLYYFEELKLAEIAEVLGLTESRVSQIRSKALGRLRDTLKVRVA
ncbi:MAG TPA: FliA/WhiG family RNA polymerase sigma factor [Gemmatimonadaceae bacterium]|nr:FliA/WhiG family RNA polymerase sigma factor [Gemmatimonadaceae bacterium]